MKKRFPECETILSDQRITRKENQSQKFKIKFKKTYNAKLEFKNMTYTYCLS